VQVLYTKLHSRFGGGGEINRYVTDKNSLILRISTPQPRGWSYKINPPNFQSPSIFPVSQAPDPRPSREMPLKFSTSTQCQNINGTGSKDNPQYKIPRLKEKYEKVTGSQRHTCCVAGCSRPYQATAHVMINDGRKGGGTNKWWVVPTCAHHNLSVEVFEANPSTVFASVEEIRDA